MKPGIGAGFDCDYKFHQQRTTTLADLESIKKHRIGKQKWRKKVNAKIVLCERLKTRGVFGMRLQEQDGDWVRIWAFKIDESLAKREGFDIVARYPLLEQSHAVPYPIFASVKIWPRPERDCTRTQAGPVKRRKMTEACSTVIRT